MDSVDDCYIVVSEGRLLCMAGEITRHPVERLMTAGLAPEVLQTNSQKLSSDVGGAVYLLPILTPSMSLESVVTDAATPWHWADLREFLSQHPASEFLLHARAVQYFHWLREHRYCGICGSTTAMSESENALQCAGCQKLWFPRIQPCIITLIHRGEEVLLAKHSRYASNYYSCIAGFAESGESLEQTLHREVQEEVGLKVKNLTYFSSQAWPFPYQLMVGFYAEYDQGDIVIDQDEIEDAKWWHIDQLPDYPTNTSIAGQLIEHYVANFKR